MSKKFYDENRNYSFDFTDETKVFEPHELAKRTTILADVDFVLDTKSKIILLEFKNAKGRRVNNPAAFKQKIFGNEFYRNISKKFYSTLFILWACNKNDKEKDIDYILLIEGPEIDSGIRKRLRNKIIKQLLFDLSRGEYIKRKILSEFNVFNMEEWHLNYPNFIITEIS